MNSADSPSASPLKVLFVDDDQIVRDLGRMMIEQLGMSVVCTDDGFTAEAAAREHGPFDLALIDYSMPGRDGVETIQALRVLQPGLRVVLVTGASKTEISGLDQIEPLTGYLEKPFNYAAAKEMIRQLRDEVAGND